MKSYPNKEVANKLATKLTSKGTEHTVVEHDGKFFVGTAEEHANYSAPAASAEPGSETKETKSAPALVELEIEGAYQKGNYVYTPPVNGKIRWFDARKIGVDKTEKGLKLTIPAKAAKQRGFEIAA